MLAVGHMCLAVLVAAGPLELDMDSAANIAASGGKVVGDVTFVAGHRGQGALLRQGAHVRLTPGPTLRADRGAVDMWVRPQWDGADPGRHAFFHTGGGQTHVTLFATGGKLLFVYKANRSAWHGTTATIADWKRGTWHHLTATWRTGPDRRVACLLGVDGRWVASSEAVPLAAMPEHAFIGGRAGRESADAAIDEVTISPKPILPVLPAPRRTKIQAAVDVRRTLGPIRRVWSSVTPWNSKTYRIPFTREHPYFRRFKGAGFDLVRLVAFSENWLWGTEVTRGPDGRLRLDFSDFDRLLDLYRAAGAEPYIRLAYHMPTALSAAPKADVHTRSYSAPRDMDEWRAFMKRIVRHCNVERKLGIRYWVTMLNEADIPIRKGKAEWAPMHALYEATTRAVREVDPKAKVGGPATCGPLPGVQEDAIRRFVSFCRRRELPPDFICFHAYRRPRPADYEAAVLAVRHAVESAWPGLEPEYFLDEWNLWAQDKTQENEYAAAYLAAAVHHQMRAGLTRSSIVSFNTAFPPEEVSGVVRTFTGPFRQAPGPRFYASAHELGGRKRRCLYTHAPHSADGVKRAYTFGRFRLRVPAGAVLRAATAVAFAYKGADGVGMSAHVLDGERDVTVIDAYVTQPEWREHTAPLDAFAGKEVTVEWRTDCGPNANNKADHGLWADPRIEAGGRCVFDFCAKLEHATTGWRIPRQWHRLRTRLPMIKGRVVTPAYFTYWLLNRLRGERLAVDLDGRDGIHASATIGALACRREGALRVLLWHFDGDRADLTQHFGAAEFDVTRTVTLRLAGLGGRVRVRQFLIDRDHTNAYTDYVVKGKSNNGGRFNLETGAVDVVRDETLASDGGRLTLAVPLHNLSVSLLEITKP